ncbi:MAG: hypothetical protein IAI50_14370, partial [Candidatus Eremiobacteraeota bacterium]|nr:hypothetical protein [Candidatus Eremiobacteraeota bacterium]
MAADPAPRFAATPRAVTIKSAAALNAYLRTTAKAGSALDRLSPDARARFLASLMFNNNGLTGFATGDLRDELSTTEIYQILSLFGAQQDAYLIKGSRISNGTGTFGAATTGGWGSGSSRAAAKQSSISRKFSTFERIQIELGDLPDKTIARRVENEYRVQFSAAQRPAQLRTTGGRDLKLLFRAADVATSYTSDDVRDMISDLSEMQRRGIASNPQYYDLYTTLVQARLFGAARRFAAKHPSPDYPVLPNYRDASHDGKSGPTELLVSADSRTMVRKDFDLTKSAQMIVISSPYCHFCENAAKAIDGDPILRRLMRDHARWLVVPDGSLPFDALHLWNVRHPSESMPLAYSRAEWPMLDRWATPTFYLFQKTTLVSTIGGWPSGGN